MREIKNNISDDRISSDATVIGLGAMGGVLAQTLISRGKRVTVWNRTPGKAARLAALGARVAADPAEAIAASPVTILIVLNDASVHAVLDAAGKDMSNRSIVNLSSGRIQEVAVIAARVTAAGGRYLAGSILAYPREIGLEDAPILYSGDRSVMNDHEALLTLLAGGSRFVDEDWGRAKTLSWSLYVQYWSALGGFFEGVSLARTIGMSATEYAEWVNSVLAPFYGRGITDAARRLDASDFSGDQASIDVHAQAVTFVTEILGAAGVGSLTSQALGAYIRQAQEAGLGDRDISAVAEVVRSNAKP
jgi:3-hydroxyisobutyrate dehydrogenase-like beta-hydroxyacid dehydrogenase